MVIVHVHDAVPMFRARELPVHREDADRDVRGMAVAS
jgi:hypothetical protein